MNHIHKIVVAILGSLLLLSLSGGTVAQADDGTKAGADSEEEKSSNDKTRAEKKKFNPSMTGTRQRSSEWEKHGRIGGLETIEKPSGPKLLHQSVEVQVTAGQCQKEAVKAVMTEEGERVARCYMKKVRADGDELPRLEVDNSINIATTFVAAINSGDLKIITLASDDRMQSCVNSVVPKIVKNSGTFGDDCETHITLGFAYED